MLERLTFVIMMSVGCRSVGFPNFTVLLVRLATQALIAFIATSTMTKTAESSNIVTSQTWGQNATVGQ